jgi:hypothetical protein
MSTPLARVAPLDKKDPLNSAFNQAQYPRALCSSQ